MAKPEEKAKGERAKYDKNAPRAVRALTKKQFTFATEYMQNNQNASEAYRVAYNAKNMAENTVWNEACKLLRHPNVIKAIEDVEERKTQRLTARLVVDESWLMQELVENARIARRLEDIPASNKALELLGKSKAINMFAEQASKEANGNGVTINLVSLTGDSEKPAELKTIDPADFKKSAIEEAELAAEQPEPTANVELKSLMN